MPRKILVDQATIDYIHISFVDKGYSTIMKVAKIELRQVGPMIVSPLDGNPSVLEILDILV